MDQIAFNQAVKQACDQCAAGIPVREHLGGKEWLHSVSNRGQHSIQLCKANAIRVEHPELNQNG